MGRCMVVSKRVCNLFVLWYSLLRHSVIFLRVSFLITSIIAFVGVVPIFSFPRVLPGKNVFCNCFICD